MQNFFKREFFVCIYLHWSCFQWDFINNYILTESAEKNKIYLYRNFFNTEKQSRSMAKIIKIMGSLDNIKDLDKYSNLIHILTYINLTYIIG